MLDFVFTVDDPVAWHSKNLKKNWNHYSFLKVLGPRIITAVQNNYGAGVYYNPLITCDGRVSDFWGQDHGGLNQPLIQTLLVGASQDGQRPSDDISLEPTVS